MEKLEIEFVENKNGDILAQVKNFPSKDTSLSQKDIWSLIEDLMLSSSSIDEISNSKKTKEKTMTKVDSVTAFE